MITVDSLHRETITKRVKQVYTHKKQSGAAGEFAEVVIVFAPLERGSGAVFESDLEDGVLPASFADAVRTGVLSRARSGIVHGYPAVDFLATLVGGKYHDIDSSPAVFEIAGRQCFQEGMRLAGPVLIEPLLSVAVWTPAAHVGAIRQAVCRRDGGAFGELRQTGEIVMAVWLGLSEIDDFMNDVERLTGGTAGLTVAVEPLGYGVVRDEEDGPESPDDSDPTFPGAMGARAVG